MKRTPLLLLFPVLAFSADLTGTWQFVLVRFGEEFGAARVELKSDATKVTGTLNELKLEGTSENDTVKITALRPNGKPFGVLDGRVTGDEMGGTVTQGSDQFAWKARRVRLEERAPVTRSFEPVKFHRVFSGAIEPVMRLQSGDTVSTWAVDAGGTDPKGVRRSLGGNPQTGPFYVEGAMPGDTLAVKFNRIRLNRDTAGSGDSIMSSALTPGYLRGAKLDDNFDSSWKLDRAAGVGMLAKPTERLKNFKVKLRPMLGCVAVAPPANQAFRTGYPGSFGGNMDYNGLREGVTVYLPVYVPGALLFVGDGHAAQGDGELNGDALETSMDIEFTVNVIRGQSTQAPRMEDQDWLMASGIANSLPEALQQATTELARWLERDYKLSANESAIVLGTSVRYDIAEVVDPLVHIVAKVSKESLAGLK
ncbi:acetamidase/formamidase family protein [uncultured Paludibaculum sp.]|uniref:acetamidase/formamidase family protein n=1 Tax=uncultured Paludibaculum sp. TaxID=1765020 RepID=UPI002AAB6639|nr:acetamidase/formamidase family protein [uncultured Paludibaculum sp.]